MVTPTTSSERTSTPTRGEGSPPRDSEQRYRLFAVAAIVVASTIGILMLMASSTPSVNPAADVSLSSSGDFLQPGAATQSGPVRIKYEGPNGTESVANGGLVPLGDNLQLGVSVNPYPPTSFDVDVDLHLTTVDGEPVADADVLAVWDMVVMYHGPFETNFVNLGNGHYAAPFEFFMFGPWELMTHISSPTHGSPEQIALSIYVWPE